MSCANITHLKHRWRLITGSLCYNTRKWEEREDRRVGISHGSLLSDSNMDGWNTVSRLLRVRMRSVCVTYVQTFIAICAVLTRMQSTHPYTHIYIYTQIYIFHSYTFEWCFKAAISCRPFGSAFTHAYNLLTYLVFYLSPEPPASPHVFPATRSDSIPNLHDIAKVI